MSKEKKAKEIHVENLVIHAKNVEIIREHHRERDHHREREHRRDPWDFFLGRPRERHEGHEGEESRNVE